MKQRSPERLTPEDLAPQIEAALFATAEPMSLPHLADMLGTSQRAARAALELLVTDYVNRPYGALEIGMTEDGFIIQVKPLYQKIVDRLLPTDLPQAALRTLTLIAAREPVLQKDIVEARGSAAYDHIKDLVERGLVRKDPKGASFELGIGPRFSDYFRLDHDQLESYLKSLRKAARSLQAAVIES
ncbi:MAG: SMC-Scp complex subunit ScpB [Candidatus Sericytochromatia bacterium]|nr:SMC-Scp complex subunit ScpB [Candidatus Tanganyikabacteria bacterium]